MPRRPIHPAEQELLATLTELNGGDNLPAPADIPATPAEIAKLSQDTPWTDTDRDRSLEILDNLYDAVTATDKLPMDARDHEIRHMGALISGFIHVDNTEAAIHYATERLHQAKHLKRENVEKYLRTVIRDYWHWPQLIAIVRYYRVTHKIPGNEGVDRHIRKRFGKGWHAGVNTKETSRRAHSSKNGPYREATVERLLPRQNGNCWICGKAPMRPVVHHKWGIEAALFILTDRYGREAFVDKNLADWNDDENIAIVCEGTCHREADQRWKQSAEYARLKQLTDSFSWNPLKDVAKEMRKMVNQLRAQLGKSPI